MAERKILLSADTPCDIGDALKERYSVSLYPLHIILGGKQYTDSVDIHPQMIFDHWREKKELPKTTAVNPEEYHTYFSKFIADGYDVLHISLGSGISSSYQNAMMVAKEFDEGRVRVIDSCNLSTGFGQLVCEAGERIQKGMDIQTICDEIKALIPFSNASFVLDTLEFLHAGGRCSSMAQLSASVLQIKPSIIVRTDLCASMTVGKKYMGKLDRAFLKYAEDQLAGRSDVMLDRAFITHSGVDDSILDAVEKRILELQPFRQVFRTVASCTIAAHCGPGTMGVLFLTKPSS